MCTTRLFKTLATLAFAAGLISSPLRAQPEADSLRLYYLDADNTCQRNVACPEGRPWFNEIRAVARVISLPFDPTGRGCTGTFVNNTDEDLAPYFLSAAHCIGGLIGQVYGFAYQFHWQTPGCANPLDPPEFEYILTTAELVVEGPQTNAEDFALQRVSVDSLTLANINVHFAGWSIEDVLPSVGVLIGHPQGDVKKIVVGEDENPVTFTDTRSLSDLENWPPVSYGLKPSLLRNAGQQ